MAWVFVALDCLEALERNSLTAAGHGYAALSSGPTSKAIDLNPEADPGLQGRYIESMNRCWFSHRHDGSAQARPILQLLDCVRSISKENSPILKRTSTMQLDRLILQDMALPPVDDLSSRRRLPQHGCGRTSRGIRHKQQQNTSSLCGQTG